MGHMIGPHEYDPDDVFYDVEAAADAAADEVLEQDAALRAAGFTDVGGAYDQEGELMLDLDEMNPEEI